MLNKTKLRLEDHYNNTAALRLALGPTIRLYFKRTELGSHIIDLYTNTVYFEFPENTHPHDAFQYAREQLVDRVKIRKVTYR